MKFIDFLQWFKVTQKPISDGNENSGKVWGYEVFAVFSVCYSCISCGNFLGYTSSAIPSMKEDSLRFTTLSNHHVSLIGGLGPLGALFGSLLTVIPLGFLGPRRTIAFIGLPLILTSWLTLGFVNTLFGVFIGRFLGGLGCGIIISCSPLYVVDISGVSRRGQLGIMPQFLMTSGILISYILGNFLNWKNLALSCAFLLTPNALLLLSAPDTPTWLVSQGRMEKALIVLKKLSGGSNNSIKNLENIQQKLELNSNMGGSKRWRNVRTLKAFLVALGIVSIQQFTGINGVTFFAVTIFNPSPTLESPLNGHIPSIVLASTQLIASFTSTLFIEGYGRKFLLTLSSLTLSGSGITLGIYFYLDSRIPSLSQGIYHWIPLGALIIFTFGFSIGLGPVSWILVAEILPQESRQLINPIVISYNWFCVFIVTSSFPWLRDVIHFYGIFWLYACVAILGVIFFRLFVPETKGKGQVEIQEFFGRGENDSEMDGVKNNKT